MNRSEQNADLLERLAEVMPDNNTTIADVQVYQTGYEEGKNEKPQDEPVVEITEKQAILFLINSGWLVNHDKELREKWERPHIIDDCDMNVFEPEKYMKERPHGKWVRTGQSFVNPNKFRNFCCSNCFCELDEHIRVEPNFCPNCGADMRKGNDND